MTSPTGHLFNNTWFSNTCRPRMTAQLAAQCLKNTDVVLIGDSTVRQLFYSFRDLVPCTWDGDTFDTGGKHRRASCSHVASNFTLYWTPHGWPFTTSSLSRHYFRSFKTTLDGLQITNQRRIVVLHFYAHALNYHSHVFYDIINNLKSVVKEFLQTHRQTFVAIKGPHAFSFSKSTDQPLRMPDVYAQVYSQFIYDHFKDLHDRVMYVETLDMTVATEQYHIHAHRSLIRQQVFRMLEFACHSE